MQNLWADIPFGPWFWTAVAAVLVIWIASVRLIFRSPKFLRKGLWFLLSLLSFNLPWPVSDHTTLGLGIPLGALYVLWFWKFGRRPTPEEVAKHATRKSANTNSLSKVRFLRAVYFGAALAFAAIGWLEASGTAFDFIAAVRQANFHSTSRMPLFLPGEFIVALDVLVVMLVLLMLFLMYRPYWWGKIICIWAGISWVGFAVTASIVAPNDVPVLVPAIVFGCGVFMVAAAVAHQIVDPRFSGSYLRAEAA